MSNIYRLTDKQTIIQNTINDHIHQIANTFDANPTINMAFTILIDNEKGQWVLQPISCNMGNAEIFMALKLVEQSILDKIKGN